MKRIATIAFATAMSTLALSAAQAGALNGISPNGLDTHNGLGGTNGLDAANGLNSNNGIGTANGVNSTNGIILNGLGGTNGLGSSNGTLNGISVSEKAGQTILEIRLPDGIVARR